MIEPDQIWFNGLIETFIINNLKMIGLLNLYLKIYLFYNNSKT